MKNKHSEKPEPDMITVFVGSWNMGNSVKRLGVSPAILKSRHGPTIFPQLTGNAGPPSNIKSWFQCKGQGRTRDDTADHIPHDIYVIGTQEDPLSEREWSDTVKGMLRKITDMDFKQVSHKRGKVTAERRRNIIQFSSLFIGMMFTLYQVNGKFVLFADDTDILFRSGHRRVIKNDRKEIYHG